MAMAQSENTSNDKWAESAKNSPKRWNCRWGANIKKRIRQRSAAVKTNRPINRPFEAPTQSTLNWRDLLFQVEFSLSFSSVLYLILHNIFIKEEPGHFLLTNLILWVESYVGPNDVEDSSTNERILNQEGIEKWGRFHNEFAQENVAPTRNITRQFP